MPFSIGDVEKLTRTRGPERSAALLRAAGETFTRESTHSERESRLFQDIVAELYDRCSIEARHALAMTVAGHKGIPKPVVRRLYRDRIEVARPIILKSPALDELELLRIAGMGGEHVVALAERRNLPLVVVQSVFLKGNRSATAALIANRTISLEAVPLDRLVAAAGGDRALCDQLALRPDIPGDRLIDLFLNLGRAGRERVVAAVEHRILGASLARKVPHTPVAPAGRSHYPLYKAIFSNNRDALVSLLSRDFNLRRLLVERIVDDPTGEPLAILIKATGIPADRAIASFADINPILGRRSDVIRALTRFYDRISLKAALHIIERWRASHPAEAIAPPHMAAPEHRAVRADAAPDGRLASPIQRSHPPAANEEPPQKGTQSAA